MQPVDVMEDIQTATDRATRGGPWRRVLRDILVFQFKLVVDGFKDLFLAQVAVGAGLVDLFRRDGSPGRRFYAVVRLSDRFDRWLDLHEALDRLPADAPEYAPRTKHSVDDLIDGVERSARTVAQSAAKARDAAATGAAAPSHPAEGAPGRA